MINKNFCLSSYIAYRYIYKNDVDFYEGMHHRLISPIPMEDRIGVSTTDDIDNEIQKQFGELYKKYNKIGILLSGGQDSAILASYLKPGSNAYTFSTELSKVYYQDIERAKKYCEKFGLNHHLVDISFEDYKKFTPIVMKTKCAPVHSIEPQIYKAAMLAKENGDELIIVGESSDLIFGGMDQLLSRDWNYEDFVNRYTFLNPKMVLNESENVEELFEKYKLPNDKIDFMKFMDEVFAIESSSSYYNAFGTANIDYYDPYAKLIMNENLDLERVRNGEPKYLIRALFAKKYPEIPIPDKIPMPRPVDAIFKDWEGPSRPEFRENIDMDKLTGNQKWQLWCAEQFLNEYDKS
ncbi:MAG: asparagine synthase [Clostridia bacterium]|nr:asparagine synthase [Clostridia bacterium]